MSRMEDDINGDVPVIRDVLGHIRDMLSIEHVPVVANLHWENLQSLLQVLCEQVLAQAQQIHNQSVRLSKAEEQEKRLSDLQAELSLFKNAVQEFQEDKASREKELEQRDLLSELLEQQQAREKLMEEHLGNIQKGLDANNSNLKEFRENASPFRENASPLPNLDLSLVQSLPQRMDTLEGNLNNLNAATANLQQSFRAVDFGRLAKLGSVSAAATQQPGATSNQQPRALSGMGTPGAVAGVETVEATVQVKAGVAAQVIKEPEAMLVASGDNLVQSIAGAEHELSGNLESLNSKFSEQSEKLHNLEAQIEELRLLIQQTAKAHTLDLEGLRKLYKKLRQDFDMKPLLSFDSTGAEESASEGQEPSSKLEAAVAELQRKLLRKVDEEAVDQLSHDVVLVKDSVEQLGSSIAALKGRTTDTGARRASLTSRDSSSDVMVLDARLKKAEDELIAMATNKADRSALEELQLRMTLVGSMEPKEGAAADGSAAKDIDTSAIQRLMETITKKADRNELFELRLMLQNQTSSSSANDYKQLYEGLERLKNAMRDLAERSDLTVLLAKRAGQLSDPVASVSISGDAGQDELRSVLNDHAKRLTEQGDMILQIEALLENKADQTTFLSLKGLIESLQKRRKTRGMSIVPGQSISKIAKETSMLQQMLDEITETLKDHDRILQQVTLGVLIMSGHDRRVIVDEEEEIDSDGIVSVSQPEPSLDEHGLLPEEVETFDTSRPASRGEPIASLHGMESDSSATSATASRAVTPEVHSRVEGAGLSPNPERLNIPEPSENVQSPATGNMENVPVGSIGDRDNVQHPRATESRQPFRATEKREPARLTENRENVQLAQATEMRGNVHVPQATEMRGNVNVPQATEMRGNVHVPRAAETLEYVQPIRGTENDGQPHPASALTDETNVSSHVNFPVVPITASSAKSDQISVTQSDASYGCSSPLQAEENTFSALEIALKEHKFRPKENLKAKDLDSMGIQIDDLRSLLTSLEKLKADKQALEELWQFVKTHLTEHAMFTGKPLLGFKCMSCEHSIEKLNPFRSDYLPTNMMPKQWLSMFTAERLFAHDNKRDCSSPCPRAPSPPRTGAASPFPKAPQSGTNAEQQASTGTAPAAATQASWKGNVQLPGPKVASISMKK